MNDAERSARELALEHASRNAVNRNMAFPGVKAKAEEVVAEAEVYRKFLMGEE